MTEVSWYYALTHGILHGSYEERLMHLIRDFRPWQRRFAEERPAADQKPEPLVTGHHGRRYRRNEAERRKDKPQ